MDDVSIYVHIPFCERRCGYCDFNTYAGIMHLVESYVDAVCNEIAALHKSVGGEGLGHIASIYFGGGTPSLLEPELVGKMLRQITALGELSAKVEITLEVNPGTVSDGYLEALFEQGVNRLSIGVQSANQTELDILDRLHGYNEGVRVVDAARRAGFMNISLDFIYGLPYQRIRDWERSLEAALVLDPEHLSLYALSVEPGTPLEQKVLAGIYPMPDDDAAADMYDLAIETLADAGYAHYEISNWAKRDKDGKILASRHNQQYWWNLPYIGVGAGAHGFVGGYRTINERFPHRYVQLLGNSEVKSFPQTGATVDLIAIDKKREMQETMMMGLRLLEEGVSEMCFRNRFGLAFSEVFEEEIARLFAKGLVEWAQSAEEDRQLKISRRGYLLANQVFQEFV